MLGFAAFRAALLAMLPNTSFAAWVTNDTFKDVPRLVGSVIAFVVLRRWFAIDPLRRPFAGTKRDVALVTACYALVLWAHASDTAPAMLSLRIFTLLAVNSVLVAIFEELVMRGVVHEGLSDLIGVDRASFIGAAIFMVLHVQAQPLWYFPILFLIGLVLARARVAGVGFGWLIALHAALDTLVFLTGFERPDGLTLIGEGIVLFVIALAVSVPATNLPATRSDLVA